MKREVLIGAATVLLVCSAKAQGAGSSAGTSTPQTVAEPAPQVHTWYGWQTLSVDAGSATLLGLSYVVPGGTRGAPSTALAVGSLTTYAFGAPLVHVLNGEVVRAIGSLGLRLVVPILSGLVATAPDCKPALCKLDNAHVGFFFGMAVASALDAAALGHRFQTDASKPGHTSKLSLAPVLDPASAAYGVTVGTYGL